MISWVSNPVTTDGALLQRFRHAPERSALLNSFPLSDYICATMPITPSHCHGIALGSVADSAFFFSTRRQHGPTQCLASVQRQLQRSDEFLCSRTRCLGRCTDHLRSDAGRPTRTGWTCRPNHARFRRSALSNYLRWTSICQSKRKSKDQRHTFLQLKRPTESQSHIG